MLWFVLVALLIGGFLVANAFSIMVAQRTRELARRDHRAGPQRGAAGGAGRRGGRVAAGHADGPAGRGRAGPAALPAGRRGRPGAGLGALLGGLSPVALGAPVVVGVLVTVASALLPAPKATAVPPLVAMREEGSGMAVERVGRLRVVAGVAVTVLGGAVLALGLARYAGALVGGGGLLFLVGVAVLAVPIARPLARLIGAPVARLAGMPGRLGRANATRSPRRTAATASALMIGLAMIVTMTVVAASQKATAGAEVRTLGAPYQLATATSRPAPTRSGRRTGRW
jgi:putative ABC transport system permease protein